jgi:hypothetical protein
VRFGKCLRVVMYTVIGGEIESRVNQKKKKVYRY